MTQLNIVNIETNTQSINFTQSIHSLHSNVCVILKPQLKIKSTPVDISHTML